MILDRIKCFFRKLFVSTETETSLISPETFEAIDAYLASHGSGDPMAPAEGLRPGRQYACYGRRAAQAGSSKKTECGTVYELEEAVAFGDASLNSLDDVLRHREETFQEHLFRLIDRRGLNDLEVYKRAGIDRRHFSKIKSNPDYVPSKKTALALAIAMGLSLDETTDLLLRAGIALSGSSTSDLIVRYCLEHDIHDLSEVDSILYHYGQPTLAS
ncbi:MAG: helix-turn-helix transcriptional regulator [Lachnospiraceae bacterium]|nr:helix-turn-helix transcriptional regulator [Lachnospiraceae bacterium]